MLLGQGSSGKWSRSGASSTTLIGNNRWGHGFEQSSGDQGWDDWPDRGGNGTISSPLDFFVSLITDMAMALGLVMFSLVPLLLPVSLGLIVEIVGLRGSGLGMGKFKVHKLGNGLHSRGLLSRRSGHSVSPRVRLGRDRVIGTHIPALGRGIGGMSGFLVTFSLASGSTSLASGEGSHASFPFSLAEESGTLRPTLEVRLVDPKEVEASSALMHTLQITDHAALRPRAIFVVPVGSTLSGTHHIRV